MRRSVNCLSIGSDNGLSPERHQAIIWTSADTLSIRPQGTYLNEILLEIQISLFKKMRFNMSAKWRPFCPGEWVNYTSSRSVSGSEIHYYVRCHESTGKPVSAGPLLGFKCQYFLSFFYSSTDDILIEFCCVDIETFNYFSWQRDLSILGRCDGILMIFPQTW